MAATSFKVLPTTSRKRTWDSATGQDVLNLAAYRNLQTTDASKPENVNGFVHYLEHVRKVVIVDVQPGSLIITVECGSLQILEELWHDYSTGYVDEMAQKFLVTKDILFELGLWKVQVSTSIPREKYSACHDLLWAFDSGEFLCFYKHVVFSHQLGIGRWVGLFKPARFLFKATASGNSRSSSFLVGWRRGNVALPQS